MNGTVWVVESRCILSWIPCSVHETRKSARTGAIAWRCVNPDKVVRIRSYRRVERKRKGAR